MYSFILNKNIPTLFYHYLLCLRVMCEHTQLTYVYPCLNNSRILIYLNNKYQSDITPYRLIYVYTMDTCSILCCNNSLIHLFHNSTVRVTNSRVSGQCLYTIPYTQALYTLYNQYSRQPSKGDGIFKLLISSTLKTV